MKYADGSDIRVGDIIRIDGQYRGEVIASMDTHDYAAGQECWACLGQGILVDTDFGGLVHYTAEAAEPFELLSRAPSGS